MTTPGEQGASSGYGLVYGLLYFFRRWMLTLWSIGLVLAAPVSGWFMVPVFVAALLFDIRFTPRALDLRLTIPDLEREFDADRPLAAALEGWPMPNPRWRPLGMFLWLSLVFLAVHVALFITAPADILRWGYMNFALYTLGGTALVSMFVMPFGMSRASKVEPSSTFRQRASLSAPLHFRIGIIVYLFPKNLRLGIWGIQGLLLLSFIWILELIIAGTWYDSAIVRFNYRDQILILAEPIFVIIFNLMLFVNFWRYKLALSLRKTDPLTGME